MWLDQFKTDIKAVGVHLNKTLMHFSWLSQSELQVIAIVFKFKARSTVRSCKISWNSLVESVSCVIEFSYFKLSEFKSCPHRMRSNLLNLFSCGFDFENGPHKVSALRRSAPQVFQSKSMRSNYQISYQKC